MNAKSLLKVARKEGPFPKIDAFFNVGLGSFKENLDNKITFRIDKKLLKRFLKN
jgi:hypothetical protein